MKRSFTAYIERDIESGMYIGIVPGITGAHTCAETMNDLHYKLEEVITLCLEEMDENDIDMLPMFSGISQIEVAL
ncbi:MAG: type II toxin-antitoxin system HicB family antitoxin [Chitinispirillales bacterium]|jgi:predicted RNase H-like HicB family nuclease|nr:type II toxin-antitoxin system HicB family antitoxin [Chitinispirillales bacterium]